jgi:hypothetical protein
MSTCKNGNLFNKNDYNSGDGMLTSVWGPSLWHSLHVISFNYPVSPSVDQKKKYLDFFLSLKDILPCKYCRENYKKNIKTVPLNMNTMKGRHTLSRWLYDLHEEINKMLGKTSNLTFNDVRERYEMFRARCLNDNKGNKKLIKKKTKKPRREKGCVKPLYGVKSKCVINIVPRTKRCKTFKVDRKCVLKRK